MALMAWYPLIKDMHNQGVGDADLNVSDTPTFNTGILGGSLTYGAQSTWTAEQTSKILNNKAISICFWVYVDAPTGDANKRALFFGNDSMNANNNRKFSVFQFPTCNDLHLSWQNDAASTTFITTIMTGELPSYKWTHVAITYDNPTCKVYFNGVHKYTYTGVSSSSSFSYATTVLHYCDYRKLCDFRIYNNCISPKQVKEISKGLLLHYPLNNNGMGVPNLIDNSATFNGWSVGSGWIKGTSDDGTPMYSFTRTGATSNNWVRLIPTLRINGDNYPNGITVSLDLLTPDISAINNKCIGSLQVYDSTETRIGWYEPNWDLSGVTNNKWTRVSFYFNQSALKTNSQGGTYSYTQFSFQLVQNGNISIRKIKVEGGDIATPYTISSSDINNLTVYDSSGNCYNGTFSSLPTYDKDSPRYSCGTNFAGNIYSSTTLPSPSDYGDQFTISWWGKYTNSSSHMFWGYQNGNKLNLYMGGGNFYWNTGDGNNNPFNVSASAYADNQWHFFTVVGNGTSITLYIDGSAKGTAKTYQSITGTILVLNGWDTGTSYKFNGSISDFRIYATALSATDILELYNTPASVSDNGCMLSYEYIEQ